MAKGKARLTGGLRIAKGDDLNSLVTIRNTDPNAEISETRIKWTINPDITNIVEVKRNVRSKHKS